MIVGMYMTKDPEVIAPGASLSDAIHKMSCRRIRRLVVTDREAIVGMVCHRDVVSAFPDHINPFSPVAVAKEVATGLVKTIMKHPVVTIDHGKPIEHAARLMTERHIGCLPVTNGGKLVGIITESDIFRVFTEVLSERADSVRITFDLTEEENILPFLSVAIQKYGLVLSSFISFHDGDRRMAVASMRGSWVDGFVAELWTSGHRVVNILQTAGKI